jgi:polar amino acid transport system substrate-binding protein
VIKRYTRAGILLATLIGLAMAGSAGPAQAQSTSAQPASPPPAATNPPAATRPATTPAPDQVAADPPLPLAGKTIKVAMRIVPPFVFKRDEALTGFSYDLWYEIAKATGANTDLQVIDTLPHLLESVQTGKAELAIAAISITSKREALFDFSQPMFDSGLQIAVRADPSSNGSIWSIMRRMATSGPILNLLAALCLLILIPAHLIWLFERGHPSELVSKSYFPGIFKAIWWATGAAGGQQQDYPHSPFGKFISALWVFISVVFVALFTGAITSAMTIDQLRGDIGGPEDLPGRKIGIVAGSTSGKVATGLGAKTADYAQINDALDALATKQVDAVVYDAPILLYFASHEGRGKVQIVGPIFHKENYGVLFQQGSPLRKPISEALLKLRENGVYDNLYNKWFATGGGN